MKAVIYTRVSTDEQADKGYSLPSQLEACRKYAETHGFSVVAEICDDYTGTKLDRPGLDQVRRMINRREADLVIVYASDRLTRRLAHLLVLRDEWQRAGIELHFVRRGQSDDTPENRMMENIEGVFNEYWREKIVEAVRRGLQGKAQSGKVVGNGYPLYGYCYADGKFIIVEEEARVIRLIYTWYTRGDGNNPPFSAWAIARKLSEMGVPTPGESGGRKFKRVRAAGMWSTTQVLSILTHEAYIGKWTYGRTSKSVGSKRQRRPLEEQIKVDVPPIVDYAVWQAAQERRAYNKHMAKRNCKHDYLLRGMVECACGMSMHGITIRKKWQYYVCTGRDYKFKGLEKQCREKMIPCNEAEKVAWDYVMGLFPNRKNLERELRKAQQEELETLTPKRNELETVEKLRAQLEAQAQSLAKALAHSPSGVVGESLKAQIDRVNKEYAALTKRRDELKTELSTRRLTDEAIQSILQYRRDFIEGLKNPTREDKRQIFEFLGVRVKVKDGKAKVEWTVPVYSTVPEPQQSPQHCT